MKFKLLEHFVKGFWRLNPIMQKTSKTVAAIPRKPRVSVFFPNYLCQGWYI